MLFFHKHKRYTFEYDHDIHSHVLPALDDGVKTLDEAVTIVKRLVNIGLEHLTCTPHVAYPSMMNTRNGIENALNMLKSRLIDEKVNITIDSAAEYRMGEFMLGLLERDDIMASCKNEVLLEHSFAGPSVYTDQIIFSLQGKGFCPVLAHPERYSFYAKDITGYCHRFKEKGGKIQVNILSFAGFYGKEVMQRAHKLYDSNLVDYYAGDIHNLKQEILLEKVIGGAFL